MVMMKRVDPSVLKVPHRCPKHEGQKPEAPRPPIDMQMVRDRFEFNRLDVDKDGVISRNEMLKGSKSLKELGQRAQRFERFDTDKDQNVDRKEYEAGVAKERRLLEFVKDLNPADFLNPLKFLNPFSLLG